MTSTISCTEERIGCFITMLYYTKWWQWWTISLFDEYFLKTTNSWKIKEEHAEKHCFIFLVNNNEIKTNDEDDEKECNEEWRNQVI